MKILFGSQTGTAQEVAEGIARRARRLRCPDVSVCSLDECEPETFVNECPLVVIVCSTTGDGDHPDNSRVCDPCN